MSTPPIVFAPHGLDPAVPSRPPLTGDQPVVEVSLFAPTPGGPVRFSPTFTVPAATPFEARGWAVWLAQVATGQVFVPYRETSAAKLKQLPVGSVYVDAAGNAWIHKTLGVWVCPTGDLTWTPNLATVDLCQVNVTVVHVGSEKDPTNPDHCTGHASFIAWCMLCRSAVEHLKENTHV